MSKEIESPSLAYPFDIPTEVNPWIQKTLVEGVLEGHIELLDEAIMNAIQFDVPQMQAWGITDSQGFLRFASGMLNWTPTEICNGKMIYWVLCLFYFILDQKPLGIEPFSVPIAPDYIGKQLSLDKWVVSFAIELGKYMDQPGSLSRDSIATFKKSPLYHYDEAVEPKGGFKTFNELFARHLKPGMRPISCPGDDSVVVYPADSTFDGSWTIDDNNKVTIANTEPERNSVNVKGLEWPIEALLAGSQYADKFKGGQFMHAFLNTFDYHRQHAPVGGTVVEANVIQGLAYLNVVVDNSGKLRTNRGLQPQKLVVGDDEKQSYGELDAPDNAGYQFLQTRGCVIINNPVLGYVAVLPIGMAQVSSVKLVWEPAPGEKYPIYPNAKIEKGDEISNFLFGGSDIVLVFEKKANLKILGAMGIDSNGHPTTKQKYLMGMPLGVSSNANA